MEELDVVSKKVTRKDKEKAIKKLAREIAQYFPKKKEVSFFNSWMFKTLMVLMILLIGTAIALNFMTLSGIISAITVSTYDGTVREGYGVLSTRVENTNYPVTEGLTAGTTKQTGRDLSLRADESLVYDNDKTGIR